MGELQEQTRLQEFVIGAKATEIVERILSYAPKIVGFGIYIWNVEETAKVVAMLKRVAPQVTVVLGGPEVSHETNEQEIVKLADYVITGWGDVTFPKLCGEILHGPKPLMKVHAGVQPPMAEIKLPYSLYTTTTSRTARFMSKPRAAARSSASSACRRWTRRPGRSR
jgi:radical SAM superfamily enzyme YgiQ (UPF0313 family)